MTKDHKTVAEIQAIERLWNEYIKKAWHECKDGFDRTDPYNIFIGGFDAGVAYHRNL